MAGGIELGEFVVVVHGDSAEQPYVLALRRGDVGEQFVADELHERGIGVRILTGTLAP